MTAARRYCVIGPAASPKRSRTPASFPVAVPARGEAEPVASYA